MKDPKETSSKSNGPVAALLRRGAPLAAALAVALLAFEMWINESPKPKPPEISVEDLELVIRSSADPLYQLPLASAPSKAIDTLLAPPYTSWSRGCTDDCSGHDAGYKWAEKHDITDADDCTGNSQSFIADCEERVNDHLAEDDAELNDDSEKDELGRD